VYATGMAKLEYRPRVEFMELLVDECEARGLEGFEPQHMSNVLNGEDPGKSSHHFLSESCCDDMVGLTMSQGSPSSGTTLATASWTCSWMCAWKCS
jgi:hypothetical protein